MLTISRALAALLLIGLAGAAAPPQQVNVYSARQENLIKPLLDRFMAQTGIKVSLVTGDADALLQRLIAEGRNSPADLFITTDAGRLHRAVEAGVVQPVDSKILRESIPAAYRHPQGYWYGFTLRARPIIYAPERVDSKKLSTYENLADPVWHDRICVRSSGSIYNQSLVAAMLATEKPEHVESWATGLVKNFARPPQGGDRDQILAVAAGQCDIALANTYYLAGMRTADEPAQREAAGKVAVFWPDQKGRGAHVNISGAAVAAHAPHRAQAIALMEFMAGDEAQKWYAEQNHEYPVKAGIEMSEVLRGFGKFKADELNLSKLGEHNAAAVRLMDRAGWR